MREAPSTIRDVAAHAGCSIATVSRVATGNGPVSAEMHKRVVVAALELRFPLGSPEYGQRPVLGVLVPSLTNPVFAGVLAGIEDSARSARLSVIMGQSGYDSSAETSIVAALIAERPKGLILTVCDPPTSEALVQIAGQGLPAALVYNEDVPNGFGAVSVDNRAAMRRLTDELITLGHRRILFVGGRFASSDRAAHRYRGYCDALTAVGLPVLAPLQVDFVDGAQDIDLSVAFSASDPTALVVSNDLLAVTVIASLRHMKLRVPEDVSVTGFDGMDIARHISPKLTTIVQPSRTMGVLAASMVIEIAAGRRRAGHIRADFTFARGETIAPARPDRPIQASIPSTTGKQQP